MSASIGVVSAENLHTGSTVRVTLSGVPTGNLEIWGCDAKEVGPEEGCPYTIHSATQFDVTLPARGIWYLWAKDANGFGSQSAAVYMGVGDDDDTDAIGKWLQDTLTANKAGMEALIRTYYPGTTIKQIHYGVAASIMDFPSIAITAPRWTGAWAAMPFGQEWHYQFSIACDAQKSEEEDIVPLATRMAEAVIHILSRRRYNGPTINGQTFWDCAPLEANADEIELDGVGWLAIAMVTWTGKVTKQVSQASFA